MKPKTIYLLLCLIGIAVPYSQFIPWLLANGMNPPLFFHQLFANRISAFFGMDVIVSAITLLILDVYKRQVLTYYPNDPLAGNAQFYLGEIAYRQQKYKDAVKAYNAVLENFSGSPKAPAAQLRKGLALLQLNQRDSGVHELRSLIQRYPQTPEALQARSKLNALGVRINPR